jgi:hypothetical protein
VVGSGAAPAWIWRVSNPLPSAITGLVLSSSRRLARRYPINLME